MSLLSIIKLVILFFGTLFLLYVSRKALRNRKTHGYYRFFVFEFTLMMVLLNLQYWFKHPLSVMQIASWVFLLTSMYLLYQSYTFLKKIGGYGKREEEGANYQFENTANLVQEGIYKYIRHPMYSSLLFLCLGVCVKDISFHSLLLMILVITFLKKTAKAEEEENINFFGADYEEYIEKTRMFVPFIY